MVKKGLFNVNYLNHFWFLFLDILIWISVCRINDSREVLDSGATKFGTIKAGMSSQTTRKCLVILWATQHESNLKSEMRTWVWEQYGNLRLNATKSRNLWSDNRCVITWCEGMRGMKILTCPPPPSCINHGASRGVRAALISQSEDRNGGDGPMRSHGEVRGLGGVVAWVDNYRDGLAQGKHWQLQLQTRHVETSQKINHSLEFCKGSKLSQ